MKLENTKKNSKTLQPSLVKVKKEARTNPTYISKYVEQYEFLSTIKMKTR